MRRGAVERRARLAAPKEGANVRTNRSRCSAILSRRDDAEGCFRRRQRRAGCRISSERATPPPCASPSRWRPSCSSPPCAARRRGGTRRPLETTFAPYETRARRCAPLKPSTACRAHTHARESVRSRVCLLACAGRRYTVHISIDKYACTGTGCLYVPNAPSVSRNGVTGTGPRTRLASRDGASQGHKQTAADKEQKKGGRKPELEPPRARIGTPDSAYP